ncbi:MAG TPA: condensation domain-containing protein, partial [Rhodocyclaceae bacterium]|nr:condensation domain-containing protein [Rhodocyclaceae bacterium]
MNTAASLLQELEALDIKLSVDAGKLRFSAPKGALTDELRARLAQEKQSLIALLEQRQNEAWDEKPIPIQPRGRGLPLSTGQQRFWFLDRLDRGNSAAFVMPPIELHIAGALDVAALQQALQGVVERHEVLHSAFAIENDQPVQVPLSGVRVDCPLQDLSAQGAATQQQQLKQIVRDEALTPFDLAQGALLLRARLLKLADNEHVFILTMHHIIGDG